MRHGAGRRGAGGLLLPVALIAVGLLWLLVQVGFVPPAVVTALWRFWPLLLIGVGLDLLMPHQRPARVPFTVLAAALLVLGALVVPQRVAAPAGETAFLEPVGSARSATLRLDLSSAPTDLTAAAEPGTLLQARVNGPNAEFRVQGDSDRIIEVRPVRTPPSLFGINGRWSFAVTDALPVALQVDGGSGSIALDLERVRLTELAANLGSGGSTIALPGGGRSYRVRLDLGSGSSRLTVSRGASLDLQLDASSGASSVTFEPGSDARVRLQGGSGSVVLDVPDDAPVRLEVRDDGSGGLTVAAFLRRESGSGDTGVWTSAALDGGGRVIDIRVEDAGSGHITVR